MPNSSSPSIPGANARAVVDLDLTYCRDRLEPDLAKLAGRRVLITGGAGFLGYYLVQALQHWNRSARSAQTISLTVLDNYIRGVPSWLQEANGDGLRLLTHDITQPLPDGVGDVDYVIHAASIASPTYYRQHPIATMDANVTGLRLLLERARQMHEAGRPLQGFLFFSSSEIYGDAEREAIPTPETYPGRVSSTGPRACYDESKRFGETLCVNFAQQYGVPVTMVRPFNNYGPGLRMSDRRVIPDLARDLLAGRDLVLLSDGSPTRTFCYVADAVIGYFKVLVGGRPGQAYNIGAERPEVTIGELANRLAAAGRALFGYAGQVVHRTSDDALYLTDNPRRRCPDIGKARREVGFEPGIELDEGLRRTLLWYSDNREGQEA
jgi:UDP-glucuronate decarboxylase